MNYFSEIKKEVSDKLEMTSLPKKRPQLIFANALFLYVSWLLFYGCYLTFGSSHILLTFLLALLWTVPMLAIQLVVMHEASHGAASNTRLGNSLLTGSISFLGGSSLLWIKQHCQAHHSFTNVHGKDHDINTNGLLRLHGSQKLLPHHRYQHLYAWLLYPLFILDWVWWTDFRDLIHNTYDMNRSELRWATLEVILVKIWHIAIFLILPIICFKSVLVAVLGYLLSFMVLGFFMVVTFQLAHVSSVQSLPENESELGSDWALRQLLTTANFATHNRFLTWFIGGLNYQIEHHIFPTISHKNYPEISTVIKEYCKRKNLPYFSYPTVVSALSAHQKHLRSYGLNAQLEV